MKTWKIITIITLATIGAALITTAAFASAYNPYQTMVPTQGYQGWMMNNANTPASTVPINQPQTNSYGGYGCRGPGYNNYVAPAAPSTNSTNTTSLTIEQATQAAQQYVTALNNPDLKLGQIQEYTNNYYVQVYESSTGNGAFELLVDKYTGNVYPEMGPNMMWNTKYTTTTGVAGVFNGIGGMMGFQRTTNTPMTLTVQQATTNAQQYLNTYCPGATVGDVTAFHGYYSAEVLSGGQPYGMLSVNGYNGQVWNHTWDCGFVQEQTVG